MNAALLADVFVRATPLMLTGVAVAIAFRAGILNIGADGQLLIGATAATAVATTAALLLPSSLGVLTLVLALIAGACAGGAWAGIAAWLRTRFKVLEVISTIMLNFVALYLVSYLVRGPLQEPTHIYPQSDILAAAARIPRLLPGTRLHAGIILALVVALATWWMIHSTAAGFRLRATGLNPFAAQSAGHIDARAVTTRAFVASGIIAGLAGAIEVCGVTFALYENLSPGYGYTAIAVALLAALDPRWIIATSLLFGLLEVIAADLQRTAAVPSTLATVIEAAIILIVIAVSQLRERRMAHGGMRST